MLMELNSTTEIDMFFEQLENRPNWKFQRAQLYIMAYDQQQQTIKQKEVESKVSLFRGEKVEQVVIISDDIAIVKTYRKKGEIEEVCYYPIVTGKNTSEVSSDFDKALVIALSNKYGYGHSAPEMICNMLKMNSK